MKIVRNGEQPTLNGAPANFTGAVRVDNAFQAEEPGRTAGGIVTFEPGARTAWHTHPLGQTLIVLFGCGWTQCEGGQVEVIRAGDMVWCPPGHRHWHGATSTTMMSHLAIAERLNGRSVDWLEQVSDEEYLAGERALTR